MARVEGEGREQPEISILFSGAHKHAQAARDVFKANTHYHNKRHHLLSSRALQKIMNDTNSSKGLSAKYYHSKGAMEKKPTITFVTSNVVKQENEMDRTRNWKSLWRSLG